VGVGCGVELSTGVGLGVQEVNNKENIATDIKDMAFDMV
jgi:hypothetical protein